MKSSELSRIPKLIRNCRLSDAPGGEQEAGEMLLMPEGVLRLKGTAPEIVRLCDGKRTVGQIIDELSLKFNSSDSNSGTIAADVTSFLELLRQKRVIDFLTAGES